MVIEYSKLLRKIYDINKDEILEPIKLLHCIFKYGK